MSPQDAHIDETEDRACDCNRKTRSESRRILRRLFLDEDIAGHEIRAVANTQDNRRAHRDTRTTTQVIDKPRRRDSHLDKSSSAHAEQTDISHRGCNAMALRVCDVDDPADQYRCDTAQDERKAPASFARNESTEELKDYSADPDGDGHCLRGCGFPAEFGEDRRDEGGHACGGHVAAEEHERWEKDLVVADDFEPFCAFNVNSLVALVETQGGEEVLFLCGGEDLGAFWEIGDQDENEERDADGE